jgi:4-amino-4-deoxy-L-arabinose transferase-like glycosyltransferase
LEQPLSVPATRTRAVWTDVPLRPATLGFVGVLVLAAVLNVWGLSREGYGNAYYAAAVRSMMQNSHAFFFVSFDRVGFVTGDKPPLGFWLQVLSVKLFGFGGVQLMLPQSLAGVGAVALLSLMVWRVWGTVAGLATFWRAARR